MSISSDYYKAIFHLSNYPGKETDDALISFLHLDSDEQPIRIAQRKAIENLAKFNCQRAIPVIGSFLKSSDPYMVESAVIALELLNCSDSKLNQLIVSLLDDPIQNRRVVIQYIGRLGLHHELEKIYSFIDKKAYKNDVYGAALAAVSRLGAKKNHYNDLIEIILAPNQNDRQTAIQDVIDAEAIELLPYVLNAPVSPFFRLRAVNELWKDGKENINNLNLFETIDFLIKDDPNKIKILHNYDDDKSIDYLLNEFFNTDFSKSYLALKTISKKDPYDIWNSLSNYLPRIKKDYGAFYFLISLFNLIPNWDEKMIDEILKILYFSIGSNWPQFIKFRPLSISILIRLKRYECQEYISKWLDMSQTPYWVCRYSALMQLERILLEEGNTNIMIEVINSQHDKHPFVAQKAKMISQKFKY